MTRELSAIGSSMNPEEKHPENMSPASADDAGVNDSGVAEEATSIPMNPVEQLTAERDELRDLLLRTRAEMDNVRKRMNRERDEERKYAALPVVRELLPALDNLHRAVDAGADGSNAAALVQGVQMVLKQIEDILGRVGVSTIPAMGETFDPNVHEALQQVPSADHPPLTVLQELEKGFQLHDRVIRPTKVIVSAAKSANS